MSIGLTVLAATTFNLVCLGSSYTVIGNAPATKDDVTYEFRVDLSQKRYCAGNCEGTNPIVRVSPFEIVLSDKSTPFIWRSKINRETGWLTIEGQQGNVGTFATAKCEHHPFTGFPTPKF